MTQLSQELLTELKNRFFSSLEEPHLFPKNLVNSLNELKVKNSDDLLSGVIELLLTVCQSSEITSLLDNFFKLFIDAFNRSGEMDPQIWSYFFVQLLHAYEQDDIAFQLYGVPVKNLLVLDQENKYEFIEFLFDLLQGRLFENIEMTKQ